MDHRKVQRRNRRGKRISAFILVATSVLIGGCSIRYDVVGKFTDANEVFRGDIDHNLLAGTAQISAVGQISGMRCNGDSYVTYVPPFAIGCAGQRGKADLTCDDGRIIDADWRAESCTTGNGKGRDQFGNAFTFAFGLNKEEAARYVEKNVPLTKDLPSLSGSRRNVAEARPARPEEKRKEKGIFPERPISVAFSNTEAHPDDIAVIIGNANYEDNGDDIPNVVPSYANAEGMKRYVTDGLGILQDNIIYIRDASFTDMVSIFGNEANPKGQLYRWISPGQSRVFVYYSGHGSPSADGSSAYLVPVNAKASMIDLHGYKLSTLYENLNRLPAKSVTVAIEACFSGSSQDGTVIKNASGIFIKPVAAPIGSKLTVISAGAADQIASWEEDKSQGLFTEYFLKGMSGEADENKDGTVGWDELKRYFDKTVTRLAMRYYGRVQTVEIKVGAEK